MKVITLKQPYATLVAEGVKKYEFRTWKTNYRGDILIHAGKSVDKVAMEKYKDYGFDFPLGCIIAKAKISNCVFIDDNVRNILKQENSFIYSHIINDKSWKGYGFVVENAVKIEPIFINGKLSFWEYDYKEK